MTTNSALKGNSNDHKLKPSPLLAGKLLFFEIGWKNEMLAPLKAKFSKTRGKVQQITGAL